MSEPSTTAKNAVFLGVQLAHDRVIAVAVDETGHEIAQSDAPYNLQQNPLPSQKGFVEQDPELWWDATRLSLGHLMTQLRGAKISPSQLQGIAVSGIPGNIAVIDRAGNTLMPAMMVNDKRAVDQLPKLNLLGQDHCRKMGFQFTADDAIAKIAWVKDNFPEIYEMAVFVHQTDYVIGKLKGKPDATEYSIAARTGCDLVDECWPDWLDYDMHLGVRERLPRLVHLGDKVGTVTPAASSSTGIPAGIAVIMGTTAETASFLASGARKLGDFFINLEDNISIGGITDKMIHYSQHLVKMYKLPARTWLFSTDCVTGASWIKEWFKDADIPDIQAQAEKLLPSEYVAYPNTKKGETFPFLSSSAEGFISPATDNRVLQFASCLQGTAMFERMCYEKIDRLSKAHNTTGDIYTGGPWSKYDLWMQCRADVTGRINRRTTSECGPPFGTALIAAMGAYFHKFETSAENMIHTDQSFFPDPSRMAFYNERYQQFHMMMEGQGYQ